MRNMLNFSGMINIKKELGHRNPIDYPNLPFQVVETVNKPRSKGGINASLFPEEEWPEMSFNDVMVFLLGGFMSIDEVIRDNANNEVLRLFQGKLGNPVRRVPLGGGNNTEKTKEES